MIGRIEKIMLGALAVIIGVLLAASAFIQNRFPSNEVKIYSVSVIVGNPGERFVRGVEQASLDYNVDVHLVSGYAMSDGTRQIEYMERELANGAHAVVIFPEDAEELGDYLESGASKARVITVGQRLTDSRLAPYVGADDVRLGQELGGLVAEETNGGSCLILCPVEPKPYHSDRLRGLESVLQASGIPCSTVFCAPDDVENELVGHGGATVAVIDEALLVPVCERARGDEIILGIGFPGGSRPYLENGTLRGLIVYSEYDAGYLSIKEAVEQADGKPGANVETRLYAASADTMYTSPLVHILFPIG